MSNLEHFKTLMVGPTASMSQIKRAYKALAKKYHPDKNRNEQGRDHSISFPKIQQAYEELRKQHQRQRSKKTYQPTLNESLLERLENIAELIDSESSESSQQDYLLHRTLEARSLREISEGLGKPASKQQKQTSIVPTLSKLELIRQVINTGLSQSSSNSNAQEQQQLDQCPSQQQILLMKELRVNVFNIYRCKSRQRAPT